MEVFTRWRSLTSSARMAKYLTHATAKAQASVAMVRSPQPLLLLSSMPMPLSCLKPSPGVLLLLPDLLECSLTFLWMYLAV